MLAHHQSEPPIFPCNKFYSIANEEMKTPFIIIFEEVSRLQKNCRYILRQPFFPLLILVSVLPELTRVSRRVASTKMENENMRTTDLKIPSLRGSWSGLTFTEHSRFGGINARAGAHPIQPPPWFRFGSRVTFLYCMPPGINLSVYNLPAIPRATDRPENERAYVLYNRVCVFSTSPMCP